MWLCVNKLSLNIPKTKFMIFHYRQRNITNFIPDLQINNHHIERVSEFNFLGITLDENLSWNNHIQKISNKISRNVGCLYRLKHFLPLHTLKLLYNSLILPYLQYGVLLWGFKFARIFKLQKKAVRAITRSKYNAHTDPLFQNLELLKIEDIFKINLLKFQFKLVNEKLPHYFSTIFTKDELSHNYNTRNRDSFRNPTPNYSSSVNTIRYYLPNFIDNMPELIVNKISTHSFKGFSVYCKNYFIKGYSFQCTDPNCYVCKDLN